MPCEPSETTSFTALLELIFVRSLAIAERAWAAITTGTTSHACGTSPSTSRAVTWASSPATRVVISPERAATKPPKRLVRIPKTS